MSSIGSSNEQEQNDLTVRMPLVDADQTRPLDREAVQRALDAMPRAFLAIRPELDMLLREDERDPLPPPLPPPPLPPRGHAKTMPMSSLTRAARVSSKPPLLGLALISVCAGCLVGLAIVLVVGRERARSTAAVASPPDEARVASRADRPATPPSNPMAEQRVRVTTQPAGATITLVDNGTLSAVGTTPLDLTIDPPRSYELVLALPGYKTKIVRVHADTRAVSVELAKTGRAH
jgi:hypothetical protein